MICIERGISKVQVQLSIQKNGSSLLATKENDQN